MGMSRAGLGRSMVIDLENVRSEVMKRGEGTRVSKLWGATHWNWWLGLGSSRVEGSGGWGWSFQTSSHPPDWALSVLGACLYPLLSTPSEFQERVLCVTHPVRDTYPPLGWEWVSTMPDCLAKIVCWVGEGASQVKADNYHSVSAVQSLSHARPPCPSPTPGVFSNSCPSSQWCHPAISSSAVPFSSCPQSLPASGSFPVSQLFTWGGQSTGVSASASVLPMNTQDWSPLGWTGWISLQSKGLSSLLQHHSSKASIFQRWYYH